MPRKRITASAVKKQRIVAERSKANLKPWQPGQSGNPAGRQKGSRNKLSEDIITDFCAAWEENGGQSLADMIQGDPGAFVRAAVALVPRQIDVDVKPIYVIADRPLTADEWAAKYADPEPPASLEPTRRPPKGAR